ncbi:MAG: hypothetical protein PHT69_16400, partial [Bacteroidales bacterium]|nr:hypothetical protein [Bacteroidales bacterium]
VDQWHLDYVYLNIGRNINDTVFEDVAFTGSMGSLFVKYQSVPWKHYLLNPSLFQTHSTVELKYVNLSNITKNVNRNLFIYDSFDSSVAFSYSGGNLNLLPFANEQLNVPIAHTFSSALTDSALFELRGVINTTPDINRMNDTIQFFQRFLNYYAYDDGSPENGYGLTPANSKLAYRFSINTSDTLKAVQMFFNQTYQNVNQKNFFLTIWNGNSAPDQIIYEQANVTPMFEDELNKFHTYFLDPPLVLNGTFYIGWRQTTADNLNVGFDRNTVSNENIFYNTDGTWKTSLYEGSLMIRPLFGNLFNLGVNNQNDKKMLNITFYPNPLSQDILNLHTETDIELSNCEFLLYDFTGRQVFSCTLDNQIILPSHFTNGLYFYLIKQKSDNKLLSSDKLMIIRQN